MLRSIENNSGLTKQQHNNFFEWLSYIPHQRLIFALNNAQQHEQFERVYHFDVMVLIAAHGFRTKLPCIINIEERKGLIY